MNMKVENEMALPTTKSVAVMLLEPYAGKLARTVLRGESSRKGADLLDRYPTFTLRYDRAFPLKGSLPSPSYHLAEFSARQSIEFGMFNTLNWAVNAGTFWNKSGMQFPDFKHFATTGLPVTERSFDTGFSLLDNYAYSTNTRWVQANISWYTPCLLLKFLPFLKKKNLDEALHLRTLVEYDRRPYSEIGYSIGFMKLARLGVFLGFDSLKYRSAGVSVSIPLSTFAGE